MQVVARAAGLASAAADALISVVLNPSCASCGAVLERPIAGCVCEQCWRSVRALPRQISTRDDGPVAAVLAIGEYDGALREIVHALKYQRRRSLARPLGELMQQASIDLLRHVNCAVPVPLHRAREWTRGFNQAREIARHLRVPVVEMLERRRATRPQVALTANMRHDNVKGAFRMRKRLKPEWLPTRHLSVVLVDDVSTTGATLDECARVLKAAGVGHVFALTAARVSTRPLK